MEAIILTYQYLQGEFVKATRQYLIASGTIRKYDPAIIAVFLLFSICFRFVPDLKMLSTIILVATIFFSALVFFLYFCAPFLMYKKNPKYHAEYMLTFSKDNIIFKTPNIDSVLQWGIYSELWESNDFYFLIQTPRMYSIVPKRAFKNSADKQIFEEIAMSNIKKAKRML
ncbi:MAG: YcxB family protein [Chitinispirillales bacterium]|jgi:hypothetical protein|nr:YcxB family protein [Chitinispirillales bacterium]